MDSGRVQTSSATRARSGKVVSELSEFFRQSMDRFGFMLPIKADRFQNSCDPNAVCFRQFNQVMTTAKGHFAARPRSGPGMVAFCGATHLPLLVCAAVCITFKAMKSKDLVSVSMTGNLKAFSASKRQVLITFRDKKTELWVDHLEWAWHLADSPLCERQARDKLKSQAVSTLPLVRARRKRVAATSCSAPELHGARQLTCHLRKIPSTIE